jgi:hypothetical protein
MRTDQLTRLEALRDRLIEVAVVDADPTNWTAFGKRPCEMTKDERGDAKWCRSLAVQTVALTMQVQRLMQNPVAGNATVPDQPAAPQEDEEAGIDAEIKRYESAAADVLTRARSGNGKR